MNDTRVIEELSLTDAYAPGTSMPADAWSRDAVLLEIERRMGMDPKESTKQTTAGSGADQDAPAPFRPGGNANTLMNPPATRLRRNAVVAAALLALILGVGSWIIVRGNGDDVAQAVEVVLASIDAQNAGDYDAWAATLTAEVLQDAEAGGLARVLFNANTRIELVEPCRVVGTSPTGESEVLCRTKVTHDYQGPAGLVQMNTDTFVVNADGLIGSIDGESTCCDEEFLFNSRFWLWLSGAYPAVYEDIRPFDRESLPGWRRDPADMLIAVQYVEEFVGQSEHYPLSP